MPIVPPRQLSKVGVCNSCSSSSRPTAEPCPGSPPASQPRVRATLWDTAGLQVWGSSTSPSPFSPAERIVESLTAAILDLVGLYCSTFNADFQTAVQWSREHGVVQEARLLSCPLSFTVYATHRIPITWAAR